MADYQDNKKPNNNMNGFSGVLLCAVDNALWGVNMVSLGLATPLVCSVAFVFTGTGVFLVQKYISEDETGSALAKGFVVGVMAGVPTSIVGTLGGTYIMGMAGLRAIRGRIRGKN